MADEDVWIDQYRNIDDVIEDIGLISHGASAIHRTGDGETPACSSRGNTSDWNVVKTDLACEMGYVPCSRCYKPVLDYFAASEDSPVEHADIDPATTLDEIRQTATDGGLTPGAPPQLGSLTEEVVYTNGEKFHAPSGGEALCGHDGNYHKVTRDVIPHHEPCGDCFDLDSIGH